MRWRHRDAGWRWFSIRSKVFKRGPDGRVVQVIGFVRDIHEQTLASEEVQRSEARYRQLTESISDIVWSTNSDFRTDYISPSVKRLLGYSPKFMLSKSYVESLADQRFVEFLEQIRAELRDQVHVPERADELRGDRDAGDKRHEVHGAEESGVGRRSGVGGGVEDREQVGRKDEKC